MNTTDLKLKIGYITKLNFVETESDGQNNSTSGFLKMDLGREEDVDVGDNKLTLFFKGDITAYKGAETSEPDDDTRAFIYNVEFSLEYSGKFDIKSISEWVFENESIFKKDSSVFFAHRATSFLSETNFKNINIPYQQ